MGERFWLTLAGWARAGGLQCCCWEAKLLYQPLTQAPRMVVMPCFHVVWCMCKLQTELEVRVFLIRLERIHIGDH